MRAWTSSALMLLCLAVLPLQIPGQALPHLERHGTATQLVVDGKPFLMLAAELHNSSSSSFDYMRPIYQRTTNYGHFGKPGLPWGVGGDSLTTLVSL
jgi:hypothetical protein